MTEPTRINASASGASANGASANGAAAGGARTRAAAAAGRGTDRGDLIPRLLKILREDFGNLPREVLVNGIAGSLLVPRFARYAIFRALGMQVHGLLGSGCTIIGPLRNFSLKEDSALGRGSASGAVRRSAWRC
jgi:hypothetical protein